MDEDDVEGAPEPHRAHVAEDVLAAGIEALAQRQHLRRDVGQRAGVVPAQVRRVVPATGAELEQGLRLGARRLEQRSVSRRLLDVVVGRGEQVEPARQVAVEAQVVVHALSLAPPAQPCTAIDGAPVAEPVALEPAAATMASNRARRRGAGSRAPSRRRRRRRRRRTERVDRAQTPARADAAGCARRSRRGRAPAAARPPAGVAAPSRAQASRCADARPSRSARSSRRRHGDVEGAEPVRRGTWIAASSAATDPASSVGRARRPGAMRSSRIAPRSSSASSSAAPAPPPQARRHAISSAVRSQGPGSLSTASRPSRVARRRTRREQPAGQLGAELEAPPRRELGFRAGSRASHSRASSPTSRVTDERNVGWTTSATLLSRGGRGRARRRGRSRRGRPSRRATRPIVANASRSRPPLQRASERKTCSAASSGYSSTAPSSSEIASRWRSTLRYEEPSPRSACRRSPSGSPSSSASS